MVERYLL